LVETQFGGDYLYPPANILDGKGATTWAPGGRGIDASIAIDFSQVIAYDEIQIVNGFAGVNDLYNKNNRVKTLQISHIAGKSHFQNAVYELVDQKPDWQSVHFAQTQLASSVSFTIKDVFRGNKYDDTCISDIRFLFQGKVIPYEGAEKLIALQTSLSKTLLGKNTAKDFLANDIAVPLVNGNKRAWYLDKAGQAYSGSYNEQNNTLVIDETMSYSVANNRLNLEQTVGYVVSKRSLIIVPDGQKGVSINGVYYSRINPANPVVLDGE